MVLHFLLKNFDALEWIQLRLLNKVKIDIEFVNPNNIISNNLLVTIIRTEDKSIIPIDFQIAALNINLLARHIIVVAHYYTVEIF